MPATFTRANTATCLALVCWVLIAVAPLLAMAVPVPLETLARHPQWLALLHMQPALGGGYHSEVDEARFFLSGRDDDPLAELQATAQALQQDESGSSSAWCRFPARGAFLKQEAGLVEPVGLRCPDLDYWRGRFHTDQLVLVYPEPYLKHVASIFGHTFLRFDAADTRQHPVLLSNALSYYADVSAEGGAVTYVAKGLSGGFAGVIDIAPYFRKLKRYSESEDRDLREYRLAYSPAQIRLFVDHVWEVRGHSFHYFFLDENCAYRIISMLDVVSPTHSLRLAFDWHAMPVDTVKALRDHGLIRESVYIPSARKRFREQLAALPPAQQQQVLAVAEGKVHADDVDPLRVLELSAQYNGLMKAEQPERHARHARQLSQLVQRQLEQGKALPDMPSTLQAEDPMAVAHDMYRAQLGWVHDAGDDAALLGIRLLDHDFHDPQAGYQRGVQLEVMDVQWRLGLGEDAGDASLERVRWFGLKTYTARDAFFRDPSWGFSFSRQRELLGEDVTLLHVADAYRGVAYPCGAWLCHAELLGGILGGSELDLGWSFRGGLQAGVLYQQDRWSLSADVSQQYYMVGEDDDLGRVSVEGGWQWQRNLSLHGGYVREHNRAGDREQFSVSLRLFF